MTETYEPDQPNYGIEIIGPVQASPPAIPTRGTTAGYHTTCNTPAHAPTHIPTNAPPALTGR
ncbi:hypothetical protein [Streptomyces violascens]|uniref:Uncharacterized protein n=1 Tax=Streptomyces violascens TaxID=67381 RepID=A0ABQ3QSJ2_9ACTN|nr:hypothetical protein [Streptomyces violascens]GGU32976.1 hypothetical protein GCM10010289_62760 [Streptomyces violascens]GHI40217.1 hypothetical protein Sviol_46250 [Streptomyces violascens]